MYDVNYVGGREVECKPIEIFLKLSWEGYFTYCRASSECEEYLADWWRGLWLLLWRRPPPPLNHQCNWEVVGMAWCHSPPEAKGEAYNCEEIASYCKAHTRPVCLVQWHLPICMGNITTVTMEVGPSTSLPDQLSKILHQREVHRLWFAEVSVPHTPIDASSRWKESQEVHYHPSELSFLGLVNRELTWHRGWKGGIMKWAQHSSLSELSSDVHCQIHGVCIFQIDWFPEEGRVPVLDNLLESHTEERFA